VHVEGCLGLFLTAGTATLVLAAPAPPTATAGLTPTLPLPAPALPVRAAVRLRLVGADPAARLVGQDALPGVASYLLGRDPRAWRTGLSTYSQVAATGVYSGIDLTYDGTQGRLQRHRPDLRRDAGAAGGCRWVVLRSEALC